MNESRGDSDVQLFATDSSKVVRIAEKSGVEKNAYDYPRKQTDFRSYTKTFGEPRKCLGIPSLFVFSHSSQKKFPGYPLHITQLWFYNLNFDWEEDLFAPMLKTIKIRKVSRVAK